MQFALHMWFRQGYFSFCLLLATLMEEKSPAQENLAFTCNMHFVWQQCGLLQKWFTVNLECPVPGRVVAGIILSYPQLFFCHILNFSFVWKSARILCFSGALYIYIYMYVYMYLSIYIVRGKREREKKNIIYIYIYRYPSTWSPPKTLSANTHERILFFCCA